MSIDQLKQQLEQERKARKEAEHKYERRITELEERLAEEQKNMEEEDPETIRYRPYPCRKDLLELCFH